MATKKRANQKGFSLVELLIVIAIMGVLAVIAFNAFNGVLDNSKKRADEQQAKTIEKAVRMLVTETGIPDIVSNTKRFYDNPGGSELDFSAENHKAVMNIIEALQEKIYVQDRATGRWNSYGPYLTNPRTDGKTSYASYGPQWNPGSGGKHVGYLIGIWPDTQNVIVVPAQGTTNEDLDSTYKPEDDSFSTSKIISDLKSDKSLEDIIDWD